MVDRIDPSVAAGLYKTAQGVGSGASATKVSDNQGASFGDLIEKAAVESIKTLKGGEKASAEAVMGTANLTDVVEAVTAAEMTLETVVAMRDRMMSAYQEIMRMPI